MKILIATHNPAKKKRYTAILSGCRHIEVVSPLDLGLHLDIDEDGSTAAENALKKAVAYSRASALAALGIDEALYLPALAEDEQPGVFVRRAGGKKLSDDDMLRLYQEKIRRIPLEQRFGYWLYAVCLALPGRETFAAEIRLDVLLTDQPCLPYQPGYPLSSLLVDPATGQPVRKLSEAQSRNRDRGLAEQVLALIHRAGLDQA